MKENALKEIIQKIKTSPMRDWVGEGDPELVGKSSFDAIVSNTQLHPDAVVLDFGCGIGRTAAHILNHLSASGRLVGVDIVEDMIKFCNDEIATRYPNAMFTCLDAKNPTYEKYRRGIDDINRIGQDEFFNSYNQTFDLICAFSVFTHLKENDFNYYVEKFNNCLKPGGALVLSCFILDCLSVHRMSHNMTDFRFTQKPSMEDTIFYGYEQDPTAFVAYKEEAIKEILFKKDFYVEKIIYGAWRSLPSCVGQDHIVAKRLPVLPADFDEDGYCRLNPDVAAAGKNATVHYLTHGFVEGRRWKS